MNKTSIYLTLILALIFTLSFNADSAAETRLDIGASFTEEGITGFSFSVGEYYRIPEREVVIIRERGIPYEEIPVVLFIAGRARVSPAVIIDLRLGGRTWIDIILYYGIDPAVFYVPVKAVVKGPPYGKAYGYYRNKPRKEWKKIVLKDSDVVNLVNLRFISEYHGFPPEEVIRLRGEGRDFIVINDTVKKEKKGKSDEHIKGKPEKHKSKGKGKKYK
ncbi:MAG: hypothetical protein HY756_01395 [Nitrospirae bacterium]|nr:hypothetical protein [Nitrospirota bacterium]